MWGPPTASGLSTPLRETIPESPGDDTFPDLGNSNADASGPQRAGSNRRGRAGTVPSQFPGAPGSLAQQSSARSSARQTPSTSPFRPASNSITGGVSRSNSGASAAAGKNALLSRVRAGSTPQRPSLLSNSSSPFASSLFSTNWIANRDRANTYSGSQSKDPSSPNSAFQRDFSDTDVKTLDYLGLVDPPQNKTADPFASMGYMAPAQPPSGIPQPLLANFANMTNRNNRFRSYSVNAKEKYAAEEEDGYDYGAGGFYSGQITPSVEYAAAALAATQAEIHQHNLDVQAFANQASSSRPRARTAGVLDKPSARMWRSVGAPLGVGRDDYTGLTDAVSAMQLGRSGKATILGDYEGDTVAEATRALWLGGIPTSTTPSSLKAIFDPFGKIESARVLTHKSCGFVNFENIESATRARAHFNGKEIFPGAGPVRIGYAKAPSQAGTPSHNSHYPSPSPDPFAHGSATKTGLSATQEQPITTTSGSINLSVPDLETIKPDIMKIVQDLGASEEDKFLISETIDEAIKQESYEAEIPPVPEQNHNRIFDAPRLRDIRKKIDNSSMSQMEIEETAMSMLSEIGELSSDYLGNTVVQKLFEFSSEEVKEAMLSEISPRLAEIGVHKNGTWAAQKIIDVARTPAQMNMIVESLRRYSMAAFLDQYGNYVMQCCLRFGYPWNNFVFEAMLTRLWSIAQGRFGARAMRACLESHHANKEQQRMLAAIIAVHSVQLATNANGALLLTWFLDTCNFPHRRKVLAPRLVPHLVHLCTHKVAYLTVLKLINQRNEPEARDIVLKALFFSSEDRVLEEILQDQTCGAMLIFKIITTPFLDDNLRNNISENVRKILLKIKAAPNQGYKRLMDEVGLSTRSSLSGGRDAHRPETSDGITQAGSSPMGGFDRVGNPSFVAQQPFPLNTGMSGQRASSVDSNVGYEPLSSGSPGGANGSMFGPGMAVPANTPIAAPNPYQQAMMASGRPGMPYGSATNGFPPPGLPAVNMGRQGMPNQSAFSNGGQQPPMGAGGYRSNNNGFNGGAGAGMGSFQYSGGYNIPQAQMQGNSRGRVSR